MNKIIIVTMILLNSVIVFGQTEWKSITTENYTIEYPGDWELNSSGLLGTKFILFSKLSDSTDRFRENVNLIIQDLTGSNISLDKYVDISENQIRTLINNSRIDESVRIFDKNSEYQKMIYTGKQGAFDLKFIQYLWLLDNKAFVLTFTAEIDEFENIVRIGKKILDSFMILR